MSDQPTQPNAPRTPSPSPQPSETPPQTDNSLPQPQPPFAQNLETPRDSQLYSVRESTVVGSSTQLAGKPAEGSTPEESSQALAEGEKEVPKKRKAWLYALVGALVLAVIAVAVVVPVYFKVIKPNQENETSSSTSASGPDNGDDAGETPETSPAGALFGGDGSTVTDEDGNTFTYHNSFGGFWVHDPSNPFNNSARANLWTPPLDEKWDWAGDRIFGVNIGGWLVLEPFISPALFEKYPDAIDEWTLTEAMRADEAGGGIGQLEEHYKTFITEQDFARIAGAGLNWVRIPIPFWAIETWPGEPFLAKTSWTYLLKAIGWARKYGLRVNLDLHAVPGSQNAFNHSGRYGQVNFMFGPMGYANAQRTLEYIRVLTEFFSQPEYKDVVQMFGIVNEALVSRIGQPAMTQFYHQAHDMIRSITGFGEGNGPFISIHDGFQGYEPWSPFLTGSDRIALDIHPYFAFSGSPATEPIGVDGTGGGWPRRACDVWGSFLNGSRGAFGVSIGGEFSAGYNDCGKFLLGVGNSGTEDYGGDCSFWEDARLWNQTTLDGIKTFAMAGMDAIGDYFFWTWKIGNSSVSGVPSSPLWSYSHGLDMGYIPTDPREAVGICETLGATSPFSGEYLPWQTGGAGAGTIEEPLDWPPATLNEGVVPLPSYTPTGAINTLPEPSYPGATVTASGWANSDDTAGSPTPISGCEYPDAYRPEAPVVWTCGADVARRAPEPTSPPLRYRRK